MKIEIETSSYNSRRYSKPWIAVVDYSKNAKGDFSWGTWIGDHKSGSEGKLVIEAEDGQIVAKGRKDMRGGNTTVTYYQVRQGTLVELSGKLEAYQIATSGN